MGFLVRVIMKALVLFVLVNIALVPLSELRLGQVSGYNRLFPGRSRFPFGETPREAYAFSLSDLDAMFAAHEISAQPAQDEFRVLLLGDSSVWGTLLRPEETLAGQLNARDLTTPGGVSVRFYNLGYPTVSVTKDLLLLDRALAYQPDLLIWLVTLEAFPLEKQLGVPLVQDNPQQMRQIIERYRLAFDAPVEQPAWWQRTLIGRRKALADLLRLQVYGIPWAATRIDQAYPADYPRAQQDLQADSTFYGQANLNRETLALGVLEAAHTALPDLPMLVVNQPILISGGENSDVRYNFYYPRAAYDAYRVWLAEDVTRAGVSYLDVWDLVPAGEFTNSAIHYNPAGVQRVVNALLPSLHEMQIITR